MPGTGNGGKHENAQPHTYMNKTALQLAGWGATISAALTAPLIALQMATIRSGPVSPSTAIQLVNLLFFAYALDALRRLLAYKRFKYANRYLTSIIGVTLIVQLIAPFVNEMRVLALPILAGLVLQGILYIVAGTKLLRFAPRLPGLKLFSLAAITVGVCSASIVLALIVLPVSMVMNIALAIIFFTEAGSSGTHAATVLNGDRRK